MRAPVVAVGYGALEFWTALRDVFVETKEQRRWVHKVANIRNAKAVDNEFHAKWPKAAEKLRNNLGPLLCLFDFPTEHWVHLKTSNPIESTVSTVRLGTKVTKGPGSRAAGLAMTCRLIEAAEDRRRHVNGDALEAHVRAGATFREGGVGRISCEAGRCRRVISGSGRSTPLDYSSHQRPWMVCLCMWPQLRGLFPNPRGF
jgi:transposase-like protein